MSSIAYQAAQVFRYVTDVEPQPGPDETNPDTAEPWPQISDERLYVPGPVATNGGDATPKQWQDWISVVPNQIVTRIEEAIDLFIRGADLGNVSKEPQEPSSLDPSSTTETGED